MIRNTSINNFLSEEWEYKLKQTSDNQSKNELTEEFFISNKIPKEKVQFIGFRVLFIFLFN